MVYFSIVYSVSSHFSLLFSSISIFYEIIDALKFTVFCCFHICVCIDAREHCTFLKFRFMVIVKIKETKKMHIPRPSSGSSNTFHKTPNKSQASLLISANML